VLEWGEPELAEGDAGAFDAVYAHILRMADALSNGIIKQFSEKF